jgi:hypothetical protein
LVYSKGGRLMGNDVYLERASGNVDSFEIKPRAK